MNIFFALSGTGESDAPRRWQHEAAAQRAWDERLSAHGRVHKSGAAAQQGCRRPPHDTAAVAWDAAVAQRQATGVPVAAAGRQLAAAPALAALRPLKSLALIPLESLDIDTLPRFTKIRVVGLTHTVHRGHRISLHT